MLSAEGFLCDNAPRAFGGEPLCMLCELQLFDDHRAAERDFFEPCPKCGKFPASASGNECYHCFSVGGIAARQEIEGDEKDPLPF